eukprot:gene5817-biopygen6906
MCHVGSAVRRRGALCGVWAPRGMPCGTPCGLLPWSYLSDEVPNHSEGVVCCCGTPHLISIAIYCTRHNVHTLRSAMPAANFDNQMAKSTTQPKFPMTGSFGMSKPFMGPGKSGR